MIDYTDENGNPIGITSFEDLPTGNYAAVVTDENGCSKVFGPFTVGVISSVDNVEPILANIFPNPARSFFHIETDAKLISNPAVYSVSGQLIDSTVERNNGQYTFDTNKLANGVYYVKLVSQSDILLKKIIIAK